MTSPGLDGFKALLSATRQRQKEIRSDTAKARLQLGLAWVGNIVGWATLASALIPPMRRGLKNSLAVRRSEVGTLSANLKETRIKVDFDTEGDVAAPHRSMQSAFDELARSQRCWSVATEQAIDRVKARTYAGTVISRVAARLSRSADALVDTTDAPLAFSMLGGKSVAYIYPGFILIMGRTDDFALVDFSKVEVSYVGVNFTEAEPSPSDAELVGKTWAKANKNGSRDRRFTNNRELPILRYGQLRISAAGGLNEVFMASRASSCQQLALAATELREVLTRAGRQKGVNSRRRIGSG